MLVRPWTKHTHIHKLSEHGMAYTKQRVHLQHLDFRRHGWSDVHFSILLAPCRARRMHRIKPDIGEESTILYVQCPSLPLC